MLTKKLLIIICLFCVLSLMPQQAYGKLEYKCKQMLEYDQTTGLCWGGLPTHTYDLKEEKEIIFIDGHLNGGPSELNEDIHIDVQISTDGKNYKTIESLQVFADPSTKTDYKVDINAKARYIRFHAAEEYRYVDGSSLNVELTFVQQLIDFFTLKWLFK